MRQRRATLRNKQFFTLSRSHQIKCHAAVVHNGTDGAEQSKGDPTAAAVGGLRSFMAAMTDGRTTELHITEFNLFTAHLK